MRRRLLSSVFASILLLVQLGMAPFVYAQVPASGKAACVGMAQEDAPQTAQSATRGCVHMATDAAGSHCQHGGGHCRTHVTCSCPCAHTPALATGRTLAFEPAAPVAAEAVLSPLNVDPLPAELLRPPR